MKHIAPQADLGEMDQAFNLAGQSGTDWDRIKREAADKLKAKQASDELTLSLFDLPKWDQAVRGGGK